MPGPSPSASASTTWTRAPCTGRWRSPPYGGGSTPTTRHGRPAGPADRIDVADTVTVDGVDATIEIRGPEVTRAVSAVAANPRCARELRRRQREWAAAHGGGVIEGRDIGSVVFPGAELKVYLTASDAERAGRRSKEVLDLDYDAVAADIARRDHADSNRSAAPLVVAAGAIMVDTTGLSIDEVVDRVLALLPPTPTRLHGDRRRPVTPEPEARRARRASAPPRPATPRIAPSPGANGRCTSSPGCSCWPWPARSGGSGSKAGQTSPKQARSSCPRCTARTSTPCSCRSSPAGSCATWPRTACGSTVGRPGCSRPSVASPSIGKRPIVSRWDLRVGVAPG